MYSYIARRLIWVIVTLFGIVFINFLVLHALPINYAQVIAGTHASAVTLREVTKNYALNRPLLYQFWLYLRQLLELNLGYSYQLHLPVRAMLAQALPKTAYLAAVVMLLNLLIGVPIGVLSAQRPGTWFDSLGMLLSVTGVSVPAFAVGSVLLYVFSFRLGLMPIGGYAPFPNVTYVLLPALSAALTGAPYYVRILRSTMLEVMRQDYIRTARAKGLSRRAVVWRHALRNALIPLTTYFGLDLGNLLGGLLIIEVIYDWPGIGAMTYHAIPVMDVPTILGVVLFSSFALVTMNLVVDVLYAILDPRITYS